MTLRLHTNSSLYDIQSEFARKFPGVKLAFIFHGDEKLNLSSHLHHSFSYAPVEGFCSDHTVEDIIINELMTTKEVEGLFENYWHLPAQVFVDIDGYWQKNKQTESWRLKDCVVPAIKN
jgi:hypothetical protein